MPPYGDTAAATSTGYNLMTTRAGGRKTRLAYAVSFLVASLGCSGATPAGDAVPGHDVFGNGGW
jgi:hypothetical protein